MQYREWTDDPTWAYDATTYWTLAFKKTYEMVIAGRSLSDIALEVDTKESTVKSRIRTYCRENDLENPLKRKSKG
jgi:hypothetical protein